MEWLSQHLEEWSLVWFGLLFWGSIFVATLAYFFEANIVISLIGYASGLVFGLVAKYRGWSWIS